MHNPKVYKTYYEKHRDKILEKNKNWFKANYAKGLYNSCKQRALRKNIEFNISEEDIKIPKFCPLLKQPLSTDHDGQSEFSPSIDRIDNSKGYIKGNVWVISKLANRMKNNASLSQLETFCVSYLSIMELITNVGCLGKQWSTANNDSNIGNDLSGTITGGSPFTGAMTQNEQTTDLLSQSVQHWDRFQGRQIQEGMCPSSKADAAGQLSLLPDCTFPPNRSGGDANY